jgi:transcriptional regulator with GAF, ATPase, and Fis domain
MGSITPFFESELWSASLRGAFTDAKEDRAGRFV